MNIQRGKESSVYFKCDHCAQEFSFKSFRIAVILYGVIFLVGRNNYGYVGIVCPNCINTTLKKADEKKLIDFQKGLGEKIYFVDLFTEMIINGERIYTKEILSNRDLDSLDPVRSPTWFLGSLKYDPIWIRVETVGRKLFYIISSEMEPEKSIRSLRRTSHETDISRCELFERIIKNLDSPDNYFNSYITNTPRMVESILGSEKNSFGFKEVDINYLLDVENETHKKIFPRYHYINTIRTSCDKFCSNYFSDIIYPEWEFIQFSSDKTTWKTKFLMNIEFINMLEDEETSYLEGCEGFQALWKSKFLFKDEGVPELLDNKDLIKYLPEKKRLQSIDMIEKIKSNIYDASFHDFLSKEAFNFIIEYSMSAKSIFFSNAFILDLKQKYLQNIYDYLKSPTKRKKIKNKIPGPVLDKVKEAEKTYKSVNIVTNDSRIMKIKMNLPNYVKPEIERFDILILGETGVGKELIAKACHEASGREGLFITVPCTSIPDKQFENQLFGHAKGAYTGADTKEKGYFRKADRGTIFLDEIGDLDLEFQSKMLRVIDEREIHPVGEDEPKTVDVMLIMATNKNLLQLVENDLFRKDMYYRIIRRAVIEVPPLRKRKDDIPLLIEHFIEKYDYKRKKDEKLAELRFSEDCIDFLKTFQWKGNVRELSGMVEKIVHARLNDGDRNEITEFDIPDLYVQESSSPGETDPHEHGRKRYKDENIISALEECGGNRRCAAEKLQCSERTIHRRIKQMKEKGIQVPPPPLQ